MDNFIHQINSQLHKMAMEIKKKREEEDGAQVYALVSIVAEVGNMVLLTEECSYQCPGETIVVVRMGPGQLPSGW